MYTDKKTALYWRILQDWLQTGRYYMIYRLATQRDLPRLLHMVDQAKASFRARGIDQWQKGDPDGPGLAAAIEQKTIHVLEQEGQAVGMITVVPGPEASYAQIDGALVKPRALCCFHRLCVRNHARAGACGTAVWPV